MERNDLELYLKKRVRITLKTGYFYHCYIQSIGNDSIRIKDKFNRVMIIALDQISIVEEVEGGNENC